MVLWPLFYPSNDLELGIQVGDYFTAFFEMDVSRSGRVRKKNSKLADFESPDDIELRQGNVVKKRIRSGEVSIL